MHRSKPSVPAVAALLVTLLVSPRLAADATSERVEAFAEFAVSAPGEAAIRTFVAANWAAPALAERPLEERLPTLRQLVADLAGGAVEAILLQSPTAGRLVVANARRDRWYSIALELEAAPQRGIVRLGLEVDDHPPGGADEGPSGEGGPLSEAEAVRLLADEIDRRAAADRFSGVVVVEQDGKRRFERAAGLADRERQVLVTLDTRFSIASIGKAFTETVVRQLAAEGKLDLDAPLERAWPGYPNRDVASRVTLRQLLDHTSGMGDGLERLFTPRGAALGAPLALADYLPLFVDDPLLFEPGSRNRYSNSGYLVLGLVIEQVTGRSYFDVVRERVFAPAGMSASGFAAATEDVPDRAVGYFRPRPDAALVSNVAVERGAGTSAGGGYSTAGDLLRFVAALADGRLLPEGESTLSRGKGIAGGSPAANGVLRWGGAGQPRIVVLANLGEPAAESLARFVSQVLARVR